MPIWLIKLFGTVDLDVTFIVIALMASSTSFYGDTPCITLEVIPCGVNA